MTSNFWMNDFPSWQERWRVIYEVAGYLSMKGSLNNCLLTRVVVCQWWSEELTSAMCILLWDPGDLGIEGGGWWRLEARSSALEGQNLGEGTNHTAVRVSRFYYASQYVMSFPRLPFVGLLVRNVDGDNILGRSIQSNSS